jgi:hypothetical protein
MLHISVIHALEALMYELLGLQSPMAFRAIHFHQGGA